MRLTLDRFVRCLVPAASLVAAVAMGLGTAAAQTLDCGRLQQQIAQAGQGGGGNRYAAAARKQASELARTQAYAHQLGCDGFTSIFGGNAQCGGLNQRIQQMQANLGQLQAAGNGGDRGALVARYNANCRGGQPRERGFFESLFGGGNAEPPPPSPVPDLPPGEIDPDDGTHAHGGGQAVCVRTCDGGFFPLGISSHHSAEDLNQMCQALCPGTDVAVYTRSPDADIKTAASLDGKPYVDLPNALKYQKTFVPQCSCRPPGKSWAETLANAEEVLGNTRNGDIMVTPEKSDELSRPKMDAKTRATLLRSPGTAKVAPADASQLAADAAAAPLPAPTPVPSSDAKRPVRQVGPQQ